MIAAEDADGHLAASLESHLPDTVDSLLDLGTGTGRLGLMLASRTRRFTGLDLHAAMLEENRRQQQIAGRSWQLVQGDMRKLPFSNGRFDAVTAGWAIGHLTGWHPQDWQAQVNGVLAEMIRAVQPGGLLIILETLSTGAEVPAAPTPALGKYYALLEETHGFTKETLSTDYAFDSPEEAAKHTEFFFGAGLARQITERGWARVPEWTGIWTKRISDA